MNVTSPYSSDSAAPAVPRDTASSGAGSQTAATRPAARRTWLVSLTVVCFLFGGLLAVQLRAMQKVRENQKDTATGLAEAKARMAALQREADDASKAKADLLARLDDLKKAAKNGLTATQAKQLNAQVKTLQQIAGLTPVTGPGVVVVLSDSVDKSTQGMPFPLGIVHDYDLLQVVNELRSAQADAIAINGRRITGYTPIRCVGPVVYIDGESAAPPFRITAIGDPDKLYAALDYRDGILDNLRKQTLVVRVARADKLNLPAGEGMPRFRVAKSR
jgi:uncharacterized protein YlxW (UPF0749 family)